MHICQSNYCINSTPSTHSIPLFLSSYKSLCDCSRSHTSISAMYRFIHTRTIEYRLHKSSLPPQRVFRFDSHHDFRLSSWTASINVLLWWFLYKILLTVALNTSRQCTYSPRFCIIIDTIPSSNTHVECSKNDLFPLRMKYFVFSFPSPCIHSACIWYI